MKVAIVAPSPIPFLVGGAENLWNGMLHHFNQQPGYEVEMIKVPIKESNLLEIAQAYRRFLQLDLDHFDMVISTKYPAWMVQHPNHHVYMQHKLRGLYDTYPAHLPLTVDTWLPELAEVQKLLAQPATQPQDVLQLVTSIEALAEVDGFDASVLALPTPLSRTVVHWLDAYALSRQRIQRLTAISATVAGRDDYFPEGVDGVFYHPSNLAPAEAVNTPKFGFFTASRHEDAKRIDKIIAAFKRTRGPWTLRIAGVGPATEALQYQAEGDERIEFLGRISSEQLAEEYARACWTIFLPQQEDYGLISLESMQAGTPIITTNDSGGVAEFVDHGQTGLVINEDQLAQTMQQCIDGEISSYALRSACLERADKVSWDCLAKDILVNPEQPIESQHIVVAVPFKVWPVRGGGQQRVYQLYRQVAKTHRVTLVSIANVTASSVYEIAPNLTEICIAKTEVHKQFDCFFHDLHEQSVDDCVLVKHDILTPEYRQVLAQQASSADLLIASHPFLYNAIKDVWRGPVWYDAHNVEYDMKQIVMADKQDKSELLQQVYEAEQQLLHDSKLVLTCSEGDSKRLVELYGNSPAQFEVVANGVDIEAVPFVEQQQRNNARLRSGLVMPVALFIGAWHGPNIEVLNWLKQLALARPDWQFWVIGSVCLHPDAEEVPANLILLGVLDEQQKSQVLKLANVALNPMVEGSGTNLKMLEYAAAGVPILTTEFGNRGLQFENEHHLTIKQRNDFENELNEYEVSSEQRERQCHSARIVCQDVYSWGVIAQTALNNLYIGT